MRGEQREEVLVRVVEHDLVVLPCVHGPHLHRDVERGDLGLAGDRPRVQFEVVVEGDGFFA